MLRLSNEIVGCFNLIKDDEKKSFMVIIKNKYLQWDYISVRIYFKTNTPFTHSQPEYIKYKNWSYRIVFS